jgi:flagellar basal-body rod modification protein FlgD
MSTTTPIPTSSNATPATGTTTTQAAATQSLGKDDFLKLFVAQLQHQDPMNPMQDADMMGQMAQFSTLEQITNVGQATSEMATSISMGQSLGLIGKTVTYADQDGTRHTGVVQKVVTEGGTAKLTVDGVDGIDPASIAEVADTTTTQESSAP